MLTLVRMTTPPPTDSVGQMVEDIARQHAEAQSAQAALSAWMPWVLVALTVVIAICLRASRGWVAGRDEAEEDAELDAQGGVGT